MANALVPTSFDQAYRMADLIAKNPYVPEYLRNNTPSCMEVVDRAMTWNMSPIAVAHCSFEVHGRIGYEGKLIAAACESTAAITVDGFDFDYSGEGSGRKITVTATVRGQSKPRSIELTFEDAHTLDKQGRVNKQWVKDVDQMLSYAGVRKWTRRHRPGVLLGVYSREELQSGFDIDGSPIIDVTAEGSAEDQAAASIAKAGDDAAAREAKLVREYRFNTPEKTKTHNNPEDWITDWDMAIARYVKADALEGLKKLLQLNIDSMAQVEAFDFKSMMAVRARTANALEDLVAKRKAAAEPEKTPAAQGDAQQDTTDHGTQNASVTTPAAEDHDPRDDEMKPDYKPVQQAAHTIDAKVVHPHAAGTEVATQHNPAALEFLTTFKSNVTQERNLGGLSGYLSIPETIKKLRFLKDRHPLLYNEAAKFCADPQLIEAVSAASGGLTWFYDDVMAKAVQMESAA